MFFLLLPCAKLFILSLGCLSLSTIALILVTVASHVEVYKDPNFIPSLAWLEAALFALFPRLQSCASQDFRDAKVKIFFGREKCRAPKLFEVRIEKLIWDGRKYFFNETRHFLFFNGHIGWVCAVWSLILFHIIIRLNAISLGYSPTVDNLFKVTFKTMLRRTSGKVRGIICNPCPVSLLSMDSCWFW